MKHSPSSRAWVRFGTAASCELTTCREAGCASAGKRTHAFGAAASALLAKEKAQTRVGSPPYVNQRLLSKCRMGNGWIFSRDVSELPGSHWRPGEAVQAIRDTIELPLLHRTVQTLPHNVPKGFLLYGPPGCGKPCWAKPQRLICAARLKTDRCGSSRILPSRQRPRNPEHVGGRI